MRLLPRAQTYSKAPDRYPPGAPVEAVEAEGAKVLCRHEDGSTRWYVDTVNGLGAVILGHGDPAVADAVAEQMNGGVSFPLPHPLEEEVAALLLDGITWERAQAVRFGKNGADVTGAAVKLARAVTGHPHVVMCTPYHGHHPWSVFQPPMNAGVTECEAAHSHRVEHGSAERLAYELKSLEGKGGTACVMLEAVDSATGRQPPAGYLDDVRWLCNRFGALMVLDEMVTGFRMARGGATEAYGAEPDLACYGKAMANGLPLSALVGPKDLMARLGRDVFFSLTHGGEAASLAAAKVTLETLWRHDGPRIFRSAGQALVDCGMRGHPSRPVLPADRKEGVCLALLRAGVLCQGYVNWSMALAADAEARALLAEAMEADPVTLEPVS